MPERRYVHACHAGLLTHASNQWEHHEVGDVDWTRYDSCPGSYHMCLSSKVRLSESLSNIMMTSPPLLFQSVLAPLPSC